MKVSVHFSDLSRTDARPSPKTPWTFTNIFVVLSFVTQNDYICKDSKYQHFTNMKKLLVIAVATLALAACAQERNIDSAVPGLTEITATHVSTRSALQVSEGENPSYNILWDAPDSILVGYAGTTPTVFTSKNESPAAEASFTGKLPEGSGTLYGIYPATSGNTVNSDGVFTVAFKDEQTAVAGSYDPEAFPSIAVSESTNLGFQNICGLLAIKVGYDDVTKIELSDAFVGTYDTPSPEPASTRAAAMVALPGGDMTVEIQDGEPYITGFSDIVETIVLNAPEGEETFSMDETYYMAVYPITFSYGASFVLTRQSGETVRITFEGRQDVERNKVHDVGVLKEYIPVTSVEFETSSITITLTEPGITQKLDPIIQPENATDMTLVWTADPETVATVDENGVVTAVTSGSVTITATSVDGPSATATIEFKDPVVLVESVTLTPNPLYLPVKGSETISVEILPSDATNQNLTWESSNTGVATVENGVVSAVKGALHGETTITATSDDGPSGKTKVILYTPIEKVEIIDDVPSPFLPGNNAYLDYDITPFDANYYDVVWSSSDESVATVTSDGFVNAVKIGKTTITVTMKDDKGDSHSGSIVITVQDPVQELDVYPNKWEQRLYIGDTDIMRYETSPGNVSVDIKWTSSDPDVVSIDDKGNIKALSYGKSTITGTAPNGVIDSCVIEVVMHDVYSIDTNPTSLNFTKKGETQSITVTLHPEEARPEPHVITYTGYDTSVISVDATGTVTAVGAGETTINVMVDGINMDCPIPVTVKLPGPITGIEIVYWEYLISPGHSFQATYRLLPENNDGVYQEIVWSSSNSSVASVDNDGKVTGRYRNDIATITVTVIINSDTKYSASKDIQYDDIPGWEE